MSKLETNTNILNMLSLIDNDNQIDKSIKNKLIERTIKNYKNDYVTSIGSFAFYNCTSLTSIDLPNVTSIGEYAFYNCKSLTSIDLPNVTSIGNSAFRDCNSLTSIDLPNVTSIQYGTFRSCTSLTSIDCPNVTSIGTEVFYSCNKLTSIIIRTNTICTLNSTNVFYNTPISSGTGYIYVPKSLVDSYKTASNWSTYASQIRAIEDYPEICG